jgi:hypothetical protein
MDWNSCLRSQMAKIRTRPRPAPAIGGFSDVNKACQTLSLEKQPAPFKKH